MPRERLSQGSYTVAATEGEEEEDFIMSCYCKRSVHVYTHACAVRTSAYKQKLVQVHPHELVVKATQSK